MPVVKISELPEYTDGLGLFDNIPVTRSGVTYRTHEADVVERHKLGKHAAVFNLDSFEHHSLDIYFPGAEFEEALTYTDTADTVLEAIGFLDQALALHAAVINPSAHTAGNISVSGMSDNLVGLTNLQDILELIDTEGLGGGSLDDDTYGDIEVSGDGTVWTIVAGTVTNSKLADMAQATLKGRAVGAGTGDPQDLDAAAQETMFRSIKAIFGDGSVTDVVYITPEDYDLLDPPDATTLYIIAPEDPP